MLLSQYHMALIGSALRARQAGRVPVVEALRYE